MEKNDIKLITQILNHFNIPVTNKHPRSYRHTDRTQTLRIAYFPIYFPFPRGILPVVIPFVISLYIGPHKATLYCNVTPDNYLFLSIIYIYFAIIPFVYQKIYCQHCMVYMVCTMNNSNSWL